jgi:hypothetical protein
VPCKVDRSRKNLIDRVNIRSIDHSLKTAAETGSNYKIYIYIYIFNLFLVYFANILFLFYLILLFVFLVYFNFQKKKCLVHLFCGIFACYRVQVNHGFLF